MKTKRILLAGLLAAARLSAEVLTADTAVFAHTDAQSAVLAQLKSGTVVSVVGEAPAGWRRVEVSGPFEGFAHGRDITKGLEVRVGASIYTAPKKDAPLLTLAAAGDKSEVIGLHGADWVQVKIEKKLQGFIAFGETANTPAYTRPTLPPPAPAAPAVNVTTPGRPAPLSGNTADMPRPFAGRLVLAKRVLNPNPPYDYQLTDATGRRFAYVDTRRLLLTDRIESFIGLEVGLTGTVRNTVDGRDLVIAAETMQIK